MALQHFPNITKITDRQVHSGGEQFWQKGVGAIPRLFCTRNCQEESVQGVAQSRDARGKGAIVGK